MTLTDFLLARIAEDGEVARAAIEFCNGSLFWGHEDHALDAHIARHDPARARAECEAKRRIIGERNDDDPPWIVLRHMATVYSDHPDYRPEWRP